MSSNDTILENPPSTVDESALASALDVAPPSRRSVAVTRVLVGLLLVALGATAATWWAHRTSSTSGGRTAFAAGGFPAGGTLPSGAPSGAAGQGSGGQAGTGTTTGGTTAAATTGTVKLVDGDVLYVATADGKVVKVKVASTTTVSRAASISDVKAGTTVVVTGTTGSDGTVAATTVTERSAS